MKLTALIMILCGLTSAAFCQSGIKIYGFYQDNLPGIVPRGTGENGKAIPARKDAVDYIVYLTSPAGVTIYPVQMWLKGEQYKPISKYTTSPVIMKNNLGKNITIIPKTRGKIQKLNFQERSDSKKFPDSKALANKNDLVVVYKIGGKFYTVTQKELIRLEPKSNQ